MATITNTIVDTSGFVPQQWALEALSILRNILVLPKLITTDADWNEAGWVGKTLNIPYPGTFVAQSKTAGNPTTAQTPTGGSSVALSLSHHEVVDFIVEDYAQAQANQDLMTRYVEPAVVALATQLENDLWSNLFSLTSTAVGTAGTNLTGSSLASARKALNTALAPMTDRFIVYSPKDEISILQDSTLANYFAFAKPTDLESGQLAPGLFGLTPYMSQLVPSNTNNPQVVTIGGSPTGGTFTLTFNGQTTAGIAYNAAASAVQSALVAITSIGTGGASVSGSAGGPYTVTLNGALGNNPPLMTGSAASLTGGTPTLAVAGGSTTSTYNLAAHKSALMMAMRPFAAIPDGSGVATATITDPMSGISIRVLKQYRVEYRAEFVGFDILYGFTALRPGLGVVVLS